MIHRLAWVGWVGGTLVVLSTTRNPLYLALTLACIAAVAMRVRSESWAGPAPVSPLHFHRQDRTVSPTDLASPVGRANHLGGPGLWFSERSSSDRHLCGVHGA
jgi:hypothetical protein